MVRNSLWLVLNCALPSVSAYYSWIFSFKKKFFFFSLLASELDTPVFVILALTTWIASFGDSLLFMLLSSVLGN